MEFLVLFYLEHIFRSRHINFEEGYTSRKCLIVAAQSKTCQAKSANADSADVGYKLICSPKLFVDVSVKAPD